MEFTRRTFCVIALLLCLLLYRLNDDQYQVQAYPGVTVLVSNFTDITLDCYKKDHIHTSKSQWKFNNRTIIIGEDFTVMISSDKMILLGNYSLLLRNITTEDEGWYRCFNGNKIVKEHEVKVAVRRNNYDDASNTRKVLAIEKMTNISLHCAVTISKNSRWTFNNLTVTIGEEFIRRHPEGRLRLMKNYTLVIEHANIIDEGWYRCTDKKKIVEEYQLQIIDSRVNVHFCKSITVERTLTARFHCDAGNVENYQWTFNNITLIIGENFVRRFPDGKIHVTKNYSLEIRNTDIVDEGIYRCMEKTRLVAEFVLKIIVLPQLNILHNGRQLLLENRFEVGKSLRLTCLAKSARPSALLMWSNSDTEQSKGLQNTTISESDDLKGTYDSRIQLLFTPNKGTEEITCVSNGTHSRQNVTVFITGFLEESVNFDYKNIALLGTGILVFILSATVIIRRFKRTLSTRNSERSRTSETRNIFKLDKLHAIDRSKGDEDEVYYSSIKDNIRGARLVQKSDITFMTILKRGLLLDRWMGKLNVSQNEKKTVVISSLSGRDNLYQGEDFEWISHIEKIAALEENMFVVNIEGLCFEKGNIYLLQEYLATGTVEQFLSKEIRNRGNSLVINMQLVLDVICGIEFLHSKMIFHPGLTTRKILLTVDRRCKLYDFCSVDYVSRKLSIIKSQQLDDLNCLPPEALTNDKYSSEGDIWSLAVLAWMILVNGSSPFLKGAFKLNSRRKKLRYELPEKPDQLSTPTYTMLTTMWIVNECERPSINIVKKRFKNLQHDPLPKDLPIGREYHHVVHHSIDDRPEYAHNITFSY